MTRRFNPAGIWSPRGRGFHMGVVQPEGRVLHFTGQVAWDADENIVGLDDVEEQVRQCYRNIETVLSTVGGRLSDIVSVTTYYTELSQLPLIQKVRIEVFPPGEEPASTSVMVAGLGHSDFLVELSPIAIIPTDRFIDPN